MKRLVINCLLIAGVILVLGGVFQSAAARPSAQEDDPLVRGAWLYDQWNVVLGEDPQQGNHPIWGRQTENTRSGPDTWRCVTCHGWDYQGAGGANRSGPNFTGFPGIFDSQDATVEDVQAVLDGSMDEQHNFVPPFEDEDIAAVAEFLNEGLIDDNEFIDPISFRVIDGDTAHGQGLYDQQCSTCHGPDGTELTFGYEGQNVDLGTIAVQEPWRFLHRTRFGTARAPEMPVGHLLGWTPQDGRDVLAYAQGFPTNFDPAEVGPVSPGIDEPSDERGGPASNFFTGLLTALGAMGISLGFAIVLGAALIGIIFLIVWLLRGSR